MRQDPRDACWAWVRSSGTACGWGLCPLGEEAPGLPVLSPPSWAGALTLPWAQCLWLRAASLLRFLWPMSDPKMDMEDLILAAGPGQALAQMPHTLSPQCPLIALPCCTQPCPLNVPLGCNPLAPFSKGELLLMLQDVVLVSPLPGSLPRLCPPHAAPPAPCGG